MTRWPLVAVALLLTGCAPASSPASGEPVDPSAAALPEDCPAIDLRTPSGEPVDLTGTWLADDFGTYAIRQVGSCVYWVGMSPSDTGDGDQVNADDPPGRSWTNVFSGHLTSNFEIEGTWADVPLYEGASGNRGNLVLAVAFNGADPQGPPSLRRQIIQLNEGFGADVWFDSRTVSEFGDFTGTYGFDPPPDDPLGLPADGCPWVEIDGTRMGAFIPDPPYSLSAEGHVIDQRQVGSQGAHLLARPGDEVRVLARTVPYPGGLEECAPASIFVSRMWPAP